MSTDVSSLVSVEQMAALPSEFRALLESVIAHFEQRLAVSEQRLAESERRIAELEGELRAVRKTAQNSSLPPSAEHPHAKTSGAGAVETGEDPAAEGGEATERKPLKKKRGGQRGHPKHERTLLPLEQCDGVVPLKPKRCRGCGEKLRGDDPDPWRHQVWELPQPQPLVTEYQRHRLTCSCCGVTTCADLPEGVPEHTSGPRLLAMTAVLMGLFRQSKSRTALALNTLFGVPCCPAWVVKQQQRATVALAACYDEIKAAVPQAAVVHCDETPFKQGTAKAWIWTFVAATFTYFTVRLTRAAAVPAEVLGPSFPGVIVTDRDTGYHFLNGRRQFCWAHLKRDIQNRIDAGGDGQKIGERLRASLKKMFELWHRYRAGRIRHDTLRKLIQRHCWSQFYNTLEDGQRCSHAPTVSLCNNLFQHFDQLWLFTEIEGIEPTNNRAERALRHAVIWRKLSHGTQSEQGSRFVETLLTIVETCRQQGRHPIDFLTESIAAHATGKPTPKLLHGV